MTRKRLEAGDAAPGERQQIVGFEMLDQRDDDVSFIIAAQQAMVRVVAPRMTGVGQVEQYDIEVGLQVENCLGEGRQGGQRTVDQNDGARWCLRSMQLRVDPVNSLNIQYSDFRFHLACLP